MNEYTQEPFTDFEKKNQKLTDKEKEEIEALRVGFNIVKENQDYENLSIRRVDLSRETAKKMLKISLIFNALSIVLFILIIIIAFVKPDPAYYASTPSGKVYGPLPKDKI